MYRRYTISFLFLMKKEVNASVIQYAVCSVRRTSEVSAAVTVETVWEILHCTHFFT